MRTTIDSAGRVVIPRPIRTAAGLEPGTQIDIDVDDDGVISIQPAPANVRIVKRGRLYVAEFDESVPKIGEKEVRAVRNRIRSRRDKFR